MHRHHFLLGLALALGLAGTSAQADNNASVRILVGFAAGGSPT
jgi:tripartite-type tricarboxylate transporter receptor subunit TctC